MKRWLAKIVVFLLLGAIVNVAVAWGCALWIDSRMGEKILGSTTTSRVVWNVTVFQRPGALSVDSLRWRLPASVKSFRWEGSSVSDVAPYWGGLATPTAAFLTQTGGDQRRLEGRGWPAISLWYLIDEISEQDLVSRKWPIRGGFAAMYFNPEERPWFYPPRPLPLRPASCGFVFNTIFYAASLWLLTLGPFAARRMIRHRRGRCIKCGYDLRGAEHKVCPECGWRPR